MDYLEESDISVAQGNFITVLAVISFIIVLYIFYHVMDEEVINLYRSIFEAILPFLAFLILILSYWFLARLIGKPILSIMAGDVYPNLRHSVYYRSRLRFFRRRFFSRQTSVPHLLLSKPYERLVYRLDSNALILVQYIVIICSLVALSVGIIFETLQRNPLFLGEIWTRSTIWTIAQLHFASVSFGLVIIVFTLNFLDRNINPLEHGSVFIRDALLIRTIISATVFSTIAIISTLFFENIDNGLYLGIVLFNFIMFGIVVLSIFLIVERIIRMFLQQSLEIHLSSVKAKIIELSLIGRERQNSVELLNEISTGISKKVTQNSVPYHQITAQDIGARPGHYIVDINKKKVKRILQNQKNTPINARFEMGIGDQIAKKSDPIVNIVNKIDSSRFEKVKQEFESAIRFEAFDERYNQDSWDQKYNIVEHLINEVEMNIETCIINRNLSSLEYNLHIHYEMLWSATLHSTFQSIENLPKQPVDSIFLSIYRSFITCIECPDIDRETQRQMVLRIARFVYKLSIDIREEFGKRPEYEKGKELLRQFEKELERNDRESVEEIRLLLRELE